LIKQDRFDDRDDYDDSSPYGEDKFKKNNNSFKENN